MASSHLRESVAIRDVTGGEETNLLWASNVSSTDFERALEASLKDAGLLSPNRQAGRFVLVAQIDKLDQPLLGIGTTVTATVHYTLIERSTNRTLLERVVATPYTAAWKDAVWGPARTKLANEGAMRKNIQELISGLSHLKASAAGF